MSISKFNNNVNYNQSQPDQPSLSADEMKRLMDQAGVDIKEYINTILTEEIDAIIENMEEKKVDKVNGQKLSENDFSNAYKAKLDGIANNANNYSLPAATQTVLGGVKAGNNLTISSGVLSVTKANVTNALGYTPPTTNTTYGVATTSANGLMSAGDKYKLDGIATGANRTIVDSSLSSSSTNPVQNKVVNAVQGIAINAQAMANNAIQRAIDANNRAQQVYDALRSLNKVQGKFTVGEELYVDNKSIRSQHIYNKETVSNSPNMYITSNGWFRRTTNTSSKRYKKDIKEVTDERLNPERLYNLEVKQFKYKDEYQPNENDPRYNQNLIGFIAEDIADVYPIATDYEIDEKGNKIVENWNERYIIPAMLKLIQEQHKEIEELKEIVKKEV